MNNIIIYSRSHTERQAYVFDFVFREIFGLEYLWTHAKAEFENSPSFKINYAEELLTADLQIIPHSLLFESEIHPQDIDISKWNDLPVFFQNDNGEIPFDIFSAVFYLISRYEEYLPYTPDLYMRFPHTDSLAFKNNFLDVPLADLWVKDLKKIMLAKEPALLFKQNEFQFLPTYDIDIAYSFSGKGAGRNLAGALHDLVSGNISSLKARAAVLSQQQKDPYDSYEYLDALHNAHSLHPLYFFLAGENGKLDRNIPFENPMMQKLFADIAAKYQVGIHPSYGSHHSLAVLKSETAKINTQKSRQHYIRFTLPQTYQNLVEAGITEDYSMGYGSINGFRASTAFPFLWFDLSLNKTAFLKVHPFCYMECNSFFEQHFTPVQALEEMKHYLSMARKVDGTLITIWHNFSLGTDPLWKGWKEVYEEFLEMI